LYESKIFVSFNSDICKGYQKWQNFENRRQVVTSIQNALTISEKARLILLNLLDNVLKESKIKDLGKMK
jgi:hypothetical protein